MAKSPSPRPASIAQTRPGKSQQPNSQTIVQSLTSAEIVFGVVGPVGSGTSEIANDLKRFLDGKKYKCEVIKAREVIRDWADKKSLPIPSDGTIEETFGLQDAGNELRLSSADNAAVAVRLVDRIRQARAQQKGEAVEEGKPVDPDSTPRAFILDSLRNPAEAALLRNIYQEAFCLIGVVCEEDIRKERLRSKFRDAGDAKIENLMSRDEKDDGKHGQQVADTFHLSDFFIDNTAERLLPGSKGSRPSANPDWTVMEDLGRLVDILTHTRVVRPRPSETAMYHAYGARMRSMCLSRQVGAALMDRQGNVIATGTNEVPRAGGGTYGSVFASSSGEDPVPDHDHRCANFGGFCRNTSEQNEIIREFLAKIEEFRDIPINDDLIKRVRKTRIGQLIEFSRSVHAEMDALLSASRQGISPRGTRLFVTTFPCHNCARHIVAAGVDEVQFIEPYLKSKALPLHGDAITTTRNKWEAPSSISIENQRAAAVAPQVLFHPFVGVAPRLYRRAFYKDRELKDEFTGEMLKSFGPPEGMSASTSLRVSYAQAEANMSTLMAETDQ